MSYGDHNLFVFCRKLFTIQHINITYWQYWTKFYQAHSSRGKKAVILGQTLKTFFSENIYGFKLIRYLQTKVRMCYFVQSLKHSVENFTYLWSKITNIHVVLVIFCVGHSFIINVLRVYRSIISAITKSFIMNRQKMAAVQFHPPQDSLV